MAGWQFIYRFVGLLWGLVGTTIWTSSAATIYLQGRVLSFLSDILPIPILRMEALGGLTMQAILGLFFATFCIYFGAGMSGLKSWARPIGMAFHILIGVNLLFLSWMLYLQLADPSLAVVSLPEWLPSVVLIAGLILGILCVGLGLQLGSRGALEVFGGEIEQTTKNIDRKCPTCGIDLDLSKSLCPSCDSKNKILPRFARLKLEETSQLFDLPILGINEQDDNQKTKPIQHTIGSAPSNRVRIQDKTVSSQHAEIEYFDGRFYLHALYDTNGTFVNGQKVRDTQIKNDDQIRFGAANCRFIVG